MRGYAGQIALVLVLVLLNAVFAGSEAALISLREGQLQRLARASRPGQRLAALARDPNRFLATIQLGITLAGFLASATAAVTLARPLVSALEPLGAAAEPLAVVLVTVALTFVTLVLGELAPKRLAMQSAERWALTVARPLDVLSAITRPAIRLLGRATDLVVRLLGGDPRARREEVSAEELREMVVAQRGFSAEQRDIISSAFEIADRTLREILVPRRDVTSLPAALATDEGLRRLAVAGRSRAPVTGPGGLDDVLGIVHVRDLVHRDRAVGDHARPALFLPESLRVTDALREMRGRRQQFALVLDERGATDGIITMEDLLEEVVGELYDETDRDVRSIIPEDDGALLVPGGFPLHDLPDIGVELRFPVGAGYTTVAGLVLSRLGHIPATPGETVHLPGLTLEVAEISGHAIATVRLRISSGPDGGRAA